MFGKGRKSRKPRAKAVLRADARALEPKATQSRSRGIFPRAYVSVRYRPRGDTKSQRRTELYKRLKPGHPLTYFCATQRNDCRCRSFIWTQKVHLLVSRLVALRQGTAPLSHTSAGLGPFDKLRVLQCGAGSAPFLLFMVVLGSLPLVLKRTPCPSLFRGIAGHLFFGVFMRVYSWT